MRRLRCGVVLIIGALLVTGCSFMRRPRVPMERVSFRERGPSVARGALVLMPGFGDRPAAFEEHGFVRILAQHAPAYDVFAADAHFGYFRKRTLLPRLERDVIGPLLQRGYRELWLVGASMGGFGAVAYARKHPERVRGLLLFAPYLGPKQVVSEVAEVGLCNYRPPAEPENSEEAFARANFAWLRVAVCEQREIAIYVAVGDQDRLLHADRLIGAALESTHMLVLPGGHGWNLWTPALEKLAPLAFDTAGGSD
jgi:pimeloyl-ACP methyl ester carboxylesterase